MTPFGGNSRTWTCGHSLIGGALYQLSYISIYIVKRTYKNRTCLFLFQRKCILQHTSPPKNDIWWRIRDSNSSDVLGASEVSTPSRPIPHFEKHRIRTCNVYLRTSYPTDSQIFNLSNPMLLLKPVWESNPSFTSINKPHPAAKLFWWKQRDSNLPPLPYQGSALTNWAMLPLLLLWWSHRESNSVPLCATQQF